MHDASELLAVRGDDVEPARAAAIDVACGIDLHAVGTARLGSAEIDEHAVGLAGERTVRQHIERANVPALRVVDVFRHQR
jgi:hypothetical protein